jgi:hypothetical protein
MTNSECKLKAATIKWMLQQSDRYTHAVTLTLKPYRTVMTERGEMRETLSIYNASANMRHFINRLNCDLFNTAMRRNGASIAILPVLEGEATHKLLHLLPAALTRRNMVSRG